MDRCPNCDATVRPNAKFCTSCGFRLPNPEPAKQPAEWRSPFATTSSYEHNQSWTAPVPPPPPAPVPVPTPEPVVVAAQPEPASEPSVESVATDDAAPVFAGWPSFTTTTIQAADAAETAPEPAPKDESAGKPADPAASPAGAIQPAEPEWPSLDHLFAESHEIPIAEDAAMNARAPIAAAGPDVDSEPSSDPTEPIPALNAEPPTGGVERALSLVDELRSLITSLGAPIEANGAHGDVASILTDAGAGQADSDELVQLREAISTANARPRDIDVMLDLVSRAAAIQDVLAERDCFSDAIGRALAALNAE